MFFHWSSSPLLTFQASTTAAPGIAAPAELPATAEKPATPIHALWSLAKSHAHGEVWGVELQDPDTHVPSQIIFQKYLNANDGNLEQAKDQLTKTLDWRHQHKPLELLNQTFSKEKFDGLGCVMTYGDRTATAKPEDREVFTFNIYGIVKDMNSTFGDLQE
jgi:phosphatidylinositol transfer protein SFH5